MLSNHDFSAIFKQINSYFNHFKCNDHVRNKIITWRVRHIKEQHEKYCNLKVKKGLIFLPAETKNPTRNKHIIINIFFRTNSADSLNGIVETVFSRCHYITSVSFLLCHLSCTYFFPWTCCAYSKRLFECFKVTFGRHLAHCMFYYKVSYL